MVIKLYSICWLFLSRFVFFSFGFRTFLEWKTKVFFCKLKQKNIQQMFWKKKVEQKFSPDNWDRWSHLLFFQRILKCFQSKRWNSFFGCQTFVFIWIVRMKFKIFVLKLLYVIFLRLNYFLGFSFNSVFCIHLNFQSKIRNISIFTRSKLLYQRVTLSKLLFVLNILLYIDFWKFHYIK